MLSKTINLLARSGGIPAYPALAIPIINKQTFECPVEHVDNMNKILKNTEKVLVVGWRAAENHFIDLIKSTVTGQLTVEAVCGNRELSSETLTSLEHQGIQIIGKPFDGGFTEHVRSREAERFFS